VNAVTYTHKGWFGVCPVLLANLDTDAPNVEPRHRVFTPLLYLSIAIYRVLFFVAALVDPLGDPGGWPIRIGEPLPGVWIDWWVDGECPVPPGVAIEVKTRSGRHVPWIPSDCVDARLWSSRFYSPSDIIAYRVLP
jgi:hypothetical protein